MSREVETKQSELELTRSKQGEIRFKLNLPQGVRTKTEKKTFTKKN
jgi:hypothetical protein